MNGLDMGMSPRRIRTLMRNPNGVAEMLTQQSDETGESAAMIFADIINVLRADQKRLAALLGVELSIKRMTPERAAELLAGTIDGDGIELVIMFNELAAQRDEILESALEADEYDQFISAKHSMMFTAADDADESGE